MKHTFTFPVNQTLLDLLKASIETRDYQVDPYTNKVPGYAALLLVKDQGLYIISPFMIKGHEGKRPTARGKLKVVYSNEYPSNRRLPGDDWGFNLPIPDALQSAKLGQKLVIIMETTKVDGDTNYNFRMRLE